MNQGLLDELRACVGAAHVACEGELDDGYLVDARKRYFGRALAVVRPGNTAEAAAVVRTCAAHGVPIVPQGGNTGLVGGGVPNDSGREVVLQLGRMQSIRSIDPDNLSMTVDAGCVLQQVREHARTHGLLFPLSIGSQGSCTIGGNMATNAGGSQVVHYGNARELCLGLEVVTAAGEIWNGLSGLRKDNSGYDLRDLFIGSEGTLGIITAASLKLFAPPAATLTALLACADIDTAITLLARLRTGTTAQLTGFEVMARHAMQLVASHFPQIPQPLKPAPWTILVEFAADDEERARDWLHARLVETDCDAVTASNQTQADALWRLRDAIPLAQAREGLNIKHDIALPVSQIGGFLREMDTALPALVPDVRTVVFGHLGDGNLHFNLQAPEGVSPAEFLLRHEANCNACVHDAVMTRGGSFAAEHGIGRLRRSELARRKSPVALAMMRSIKQALDPHNLMNPGRVLQDAGQDA
ncbi:FAD-binding oxidoreductase [Thermomonas sp. HDW16]|uniref:FAD-binding oxidoreductase n=1 Tax=Thermomonas sp. HDW16 TaxID=2714945 RepID=UPI00140CCA0C|nr:FAD-binding oxidoreductase [Thermomonas sp. HDW16]QIL20316.1 FAD-binding oxidoreductase [Thermomonas sp. HDW16]